MRFSLFGKKAELPENIIRERLCFTGKVQNVGFRYEVHRLADELGVTGNVQNCYDGTVLAELQGTRERIDAIVAELSRVPRFRIDSVEAERLSPDASEKKFRYLN